MALARRSLRLSLLAAMMLTAALSLAASYLVVGVLARSHELAAEQRKAAITAAAIARAAAGGERAEFYAAVQSLLPLDRLVVYRGGRVFFASPASAGAPMR